MGRLPIVGYPKEPKEPKEHIVEGFEGSKEYSQTPTKEIELIVKPVIGFKGYEVIEAYKENPIDNLGETIGDALNTYIERHLKDEGSIILKLNITTTNDQSFKNRQCGIDDYETGEY